MADATTTSERWRQPNRPYGSASPHRAAAKPAARFRIPALAAANMRCVTVVGAAPFKVEFSRRHGSDIAHNKAF